MRAPKRLKQAAKCSHWRIGSRKSAPNARCRAGNELERALHEAINCEDYERAAQVRDELRNLKPAE